MDDILKELELLQEKVQVLIESVGLNPLNKFDTLPLTTENVNHYKDLHDTEHLDRIITYPTYPEYQGTMFIDKNNHIVAYVNVNKNTHTIQALEVASNYRGQGLAKHLLQYAEDKHGATKLTVNKKNKIAQHVYHSCGWKIDGETESGKQYWMSKGKSGLLNESKKFDTIFYHGANEIYPKIAPVSPNMGNKWEPAKWVTYMFMDHEKALKWAVKRAFDRVKIEDSSIDIKALIYMCDNNVYCGSKDYEKVKKLVVGRTAYIYWIKVDPKSIGVGHLGALDEYTSTDPNPEVLKIEKIKITEKLYDSIVRKIDEKELEENLSDAKFNHNARGDLAGLMYEPYETMKRERYIIRRMKLGSIGQKDDIDQAVKNFEKLEKMYEPFPTIQDLARWIWDKCKALDKDDDTRFIWPEEILKKKKASCMDLAIFIRQYCYAKDIKNHTLAEVYFTYLNSPNSKGINRAGHIVCMYKDNETEKWCIIQNSGPDRLRKIIFTGNDSAQDTIDLFGKAFFPNLIDNVKNTKPNLVVLDKVCTVATDGKLGEFDRTIYGKDSNYIHTNKQKIISKLFNH